MTALDPRHALFPGSFDPPTRGHADLVARALALFDRVTLAVGAHPTKAGLFTPAERVALLEELVRGLGQGGASERCRVVQLSGLLVDGCREHGCGVVLRGLRSGSDFDYEAQMAATNRAMEPGIDTLYLGAAPGLGHLSSTLARQIATMGGDVSSLVPPSVAVAIAARRDRRPEPSPPRTSER